MSLEKFIRGKVDDCAHMGRRANVRRLEAAIDHQYNWEQEMEPGVHYDVDITMQQNGERHQDNLNILHGHFYKGTYYHYGVAQPHSKKP